MPNNIQIQVGDPCQQNWNQMTPAEQGRFCQSCSKVVTDFSMMTDRELLHYLTEKNVNLCGRFAGDQLQRVLAPASRKRFSWAYAWNLALAGILPASSAFSQACPPPDGRRPAVKVQSVPRPGEMSNQSVTCTVFDSVNNIRLKSIFVHFKETHENISVSAEGSFSIPANKTDQLIAVSALGYIESEYLVGSAGARNVQLYLEPIKVDTVPILLNPDFAFGPDVSIVMGAFVSYREVDTVERFTRKVKEIIPEVIRKRDITLYPNPTVAGKPLLMSVNIKQEGEYTIEVMDANGRLMHLGKKQILSKSQRISVDTDERWSKGIYWIRVSSKDSRSVYHARAVVQ